jgi:hypothetical protein
MLEAMSQGKNAGTIELTIITYITRRDGLPKKTTTFRNGRKK